MFGTLRQFLPRSDSMHALKRRFPDLIINDGVVVRASTRLNVGRGCFFDLRAYLTCAPIAGTLGWIEMGDNVEIGPYCVLWGQGGIRIGSNVHIGSHVCITAHEARQVSPQVSDPFAPLEFDVASVTIESHVLICSGVQIIPGVRIGHHAMIGAGAVVTHDIPPYALAVGVPARPMRYTNELSAVKDRH